MNKHKDDISQKIKEQCASLIHAQNQVKNGERHRLYGKAAKWRKIAAERQAEIIRLANELDQIS